MIALTQITNTEIFAFRTALVFKLLSRKVLFIDRKDSKNLKKYATFKENDNFQGWATAKLYIVGMGNFQDTFETCKRLFISAFSICMTTFKIWKFQILVLHGIYREKYPSQRKFFELQRLYSSKWKACTCISS